MIVFEAILQHSAIPSKPTRFSSCTAACTADKENPHILKTITNRLFFLLAYSISSVAYYPARVGNVLGSEHIYGGGPPLPSPPIVFILGQAGFEPTTSGVRVQVLNL